MSIKDYIKEKWYMFIIIIISSIFVFAICLLDNSLFLPNSNTRYILFGILGFMLIFIVIDFFISSSRVKKLTKFIKAGGTGNEEFVFPADRIYAKEIGELANELNRYRAKAASDSADELDFITKWVHDVKVPISAMKLLLENETDDIKEKLEMELLSIEQNTQKVLFHIKSSSFYDDYKISKVKIRSMINAALKQFSTFFAYKKIALKLDNNDFDVLTDPKWSGYIISQLLSNAVKHTPENGEIAINVSKKNNSVMLSVKNTGLGIKTADIKQVFNRGYTTHDNRHRAISTGYGLYLSKKLADKLGHDLTAVSKHGEYAIFNLVFSNDNSLFM